MGRIGAGICVRALVGEGKDERRGAAGVVAVDACSRRVLPRDPGYSNRENWQGGGRAGSSPLSHPAERGEWSSGGWGVRGVMGGRCQDV